MKYYIEKNGINTEVSKQEFEEKVALLNSNGERYGIVGNKVVPIELIPQQKRKGC